MQIIGVAATKGGVAKTTLVAALGAEACRRGYKACAIDADGQLSLQRFIESRAAQAGIEDRPPLIVDKYLDRSIARAKAAGYELALVDGMPGAVAKNEQIVEQSTAVVLPTQASPLDAEAIDVMVTLCRQHKRKFVFVLTRTLTGAAGAKITAGAREFLASSGTVLKAEMQNRPEYINSMLYGRTVVDCGAKATTAAKEIAAIFSELELQLGIKRKPSPKGRA